MLNNIIKNKKLNLCFSTLFPKAQYDVLPSVFANNGPFCLSLRQNTTIAIVMITIKITAMTINAIVVGDIPFWSFLFLPWFSSIFFIVVGSTGFLVVLPCSVDLK